MNKDQFDALHSYVQANPEVSAAEIPGMDRTLVYGYDLDRNTWHVYLADGMIHRVVYGHDKVVKSHERGPVWEVERLVPPKRAYPERTDFYFARLCAERGEPITFTTWRELDSDAAFHGLVP